MPARQVKPGRLGVYATYTHPDDPINGSTLIRRVAKHGLDEFVDLFPQARSSTHVFMSACRSVESRTNNDIEIEVDEVLNTATECTYQITHRVRDRKNKLIEHSKAMTLALDKDTGDITVRQLDDYDALKGLVDAIRTHYAKNTKTVHGQKIRNAIRDVILRIGGQNIRRKAGGLYFVPEEWASDRGMQPTRAVLDGLADLLEECYGDRGDFYVIPCPDDDEMREIVAKHFQINAKVKSAEVLERALQRVRRGKLDKAVRADFLGNLVGEYRHLAGALDQFDSMVGIERGEIEANLRDLEDAIGKLQDLSDS